MRRSNRDPEKAFVADIVTVWFYYRSVKSKVTGVKKKTRSGHELMQRRRRRKSRNADDEFYRRPRKVAAGTRPRTAERGG